MISDDFYDIRDIAYYLLVRESFLLLLILFTIMSLFFIFEVKYQLLVKRIRFNLVFQFFCYICSYRDL